MSSSLPRNTFKRALAEGRQQIGLWCTMPGTTIAEIAAGAGFDWLLFDGEHSPMDFIAAQAQLQTAAAYPVATVVRAVENSTSEIKRMLDIGALTLMIPYVQTPEEAEQAVAAMRYPPRGVRGVAGTTRATRYGALKDYATRAEEELCLIVQIETAASLPRIEEIAAVDGVDALFIGPADLAASMGYPGQGSHPEVKAAVFDAVKRIRAAGKPAGVLTLDKVFLRELMEAGTLFTAVGVDAALLANGARALAQEFKAE